MRLIDADALYQYMEDAAWCKNCPDKKIGCYYDCKFPDCCTREWERVLNEQPTAIVKCGECKYFERSNPYGTYDDGVYYNCEYWEYEASAPVKEDDFCSYGKRK